MSAATVGPLDKLITGAQPKLLEQIQKVILLGRLTFMHLSREYAWTRKRFDLFWLSDILGLKAMELDKVQGLVQRESEVAGIYLNQSLGFYFSIEPVYVRLV